MKTITVVLTLFIFTTLRIHSQPWTPDLQNGRYKNPIIFADYSDPDVIRVGTDFYMIASSFNCTPGIPILHSKDLVNWTIISHVYAQFPVGRYTMPVHGHGSWAPSLRYHNDKFWVYVCSPVEGLFMATATDINGPWIMKHIVKTPQWEDPCPFWDSDGNAYLVHSKLCGGTLTLHKMSSDGKVLLDNGTIIFEDKLNQPYAEGPKMYKINGYYYIFTPAGGVAEGWQTVLRSKNIYGPYESKIVMHQGNTDINGPHQGGLVTLENGESWFIHFQDRGAYGRIIHLQPVTWKNDWPLIGSDVNGDGIGEPVAEWAKPDVGKRFPVQNPQTTDEFNSKTPGLQWQWHANWKSKWFSLKERSGFIRLFSQPAITEFGNLWFVPNLLLQKFPAPEFSATTLVEFEPESDNERAGICIMGAKFAFAAVYREKGSFKLGYFEGKYDDCGSVPLELAKVDLKSNRLFLKVKVDATANCTFAYSLDGENFIPINTKFQAVPGRWIGAKVGIFSVNPNIKSISGYADFDWFKIKL